MSASALLLRPCGRKTDSRLFAMEQLGLSYITAVARRRGIAVDIVDGFLDPDGYNGVLRTVENGDYTVIGYPVYPETLRRVAKDIASLRARGVTTHVTVGNHLPTLSPELVLREVPEVDSAIRGEGELTFAELAALLAAGGDLGTVRGLSYRSGGVILHNRPRPNVADLDGLPFPARDTLPLVLGAGNAPLVYSSRGCNFRCEFCSVHNFFRASPNGAWRGRSAGNVVAEIEQLVEEFGTTEFAFADEEFMGHGRAGIERARAFADELLRRGIRVRWYIESRSGDVRPDLFLRLKEAGLSAVFMGIESGYDPALKELGKGLRVAQHLRALEVLRELEILASIGFIMFRPTTTFEEIEHNLSFLEEVGCAEITALFTKLRVYSGTELERSLADNGNLRGSYPLQDWGFADPRVGLLFRILSESADAISVSYNSFARLRRTGRLTFAECAALQRALNADPIRITRWLLQEIQKNSDAPEALAEEARKRFRSACEDFLRLLRFSEIVLENRAPDGVQLLNPMSLC